MLNKYQRGTVWWYDFPKIDGMTHIQRGKRPVIIISNNRGNAVSPVVSVIPCTTKADRLDFIHPSFILADVKSFACVEQMQVVDKIRLYDFCGMLDDETITKIEDAMKIEFALDKPANRDENILHELKCISQTLDRLEFAKSEQVKSDIEKDKELKETMNTIKAKISKYSGMSAVEKFNAKYNQQSEVKKNETQTKRSYRKWTIKDKKALIDEYIACGDDIEARKQVVQNWNLPSMKQLQSYISKFKKEI